MPELPQLPKEKLTNLTPLARERRDAMLPVLLAEVRRVRRRRRTARVASITAACALISGVLALALLRTSPTLSNQPLAKSNSQSAPRATYTTPNAGTPTPRIEIVQTSPDILERLSVRAPALVLVEYINTDQALALLESNGDRYGIIEIAGRVEFQRIARK